MTNPAYPIDGSRDALWMHTATDAPATTPLQTHVQCDVAIIGGGFTGLNAALHLAEAGVSVAVLEARTLGFGASGRSGGQVNLGLNVGPDGLIERFGDETGRRLVQSITGLPDEVFALIKRFKLQCDPVQNGWVQGATTPQQLSQQRQLAGEYARHGFDFEQLDAGQIAERTGAQGYRGGLCCAVAGSLQPLSYTRELARAAIELGAKVHTQSPVVALRQRTDGWALQTPQGQLDCGQVLIATNGYTDALVNGLAQKIVPVRSVLIASEPLPDNLRKSILPGEITFVDKRRLILYFRYDRDGRLCVGDHGPMRDAFCLADFDALKRRVVRVFPKLARSRWDFHWGGRIAMTKNSLPFITRPAPGLTAAMGYNGRGVGMATLAGRVLAQSAMGMADNELAFPVTSPETFRLHRFHKTGVNISIKWFALRDYLESRQNSLQ